MSTVNERSGAAAPGLVRRADAVGAWRAGTGVALRRREASEP
jgi:hypothetical protein